MAVNQVEIVVSDGSRSYQAAIAQYLPDARHVLDRFHVVRWFTWTRTHSGTTRDTTPRPPTGVPATFEPDLFRARFTLHAGRQPRAKPTRRTSTDLFDAHPRLRTAWDALFKSSTSSTEADNPDQANQALGWFADLYATGCRRPEYHQVVDTIIAWGEPAQIFRCLTTPPDDGLSNGPIEGTNNLHQVLRRVAHRFTNPNHLRRRRPS